MAASRGHPIGPPARGAWRVCRNRFRRRAARRRAARSRSCRALSARRWRWSTEPLERHAAERKCASIAAGDIPPPVHAAICEPGPVGDRDQRRELRGVTPFPALDHLLTEFIRSVRSTLGTRVVGVYLTGSFALGGGDAVSDCDVLVVTNGDVSGRDEQALRDLHARVPRWKGYWASNLEGSYAPKSDLETLATLGRPWLYVDRGARELEWSGHCNTTDVRWVLRERPLILHGADPCEFTCEVPTIALQREMQRNIETFLDALLSWTTFDISWTQRYAVEATSRMLYTLERGEVISKQDALAWATEATPAAWRSLIDQVRHDRFVQWNDPPPPGAVERTLAFVGYVQQRARTCTDELKKGVAEEDWKSAT